MKFSSNFRCKTTLNRVKDTFFNILISLATSILFFIHHHPKKIKLQRRVHFSITYLKSCYNGVVLAVSTLFTNFAALAVFHTVFDHQVNFRLNEALTWIHITFNRAVCGGQLFADNPLFVYDFLAFKEYCTFELKLSTYIIFEWRK